MKILSFSLFFMSSRSQIDRLREQWFSQIVNAAPPPPLPGVVIIPVAPVPPPLAQQGHAALNHQLQNQVNHFFDDDDITAQRVIDSRSDTHLPRYNRHTSLRENYLTLVGISDQYDHQLTQVQAGTQPTGSMNWILNHEFYRGALQVAREFGENAQIRNRFRGAPAQVFRSGVVEYMQFLEVKIQKWVYNAAESLYTQGLVGSQSFQYMNQMLNQDRVSVNNSLRDLFYHFYNGNNLRPLSVAHLNSDIRRIMDLVIDAIKSSFYNAPDQSNFLRLLPLLRDREHDRANRWIYELDDADPYLTLIFAITMIRFPTANTEKAHELLPFTMVFPFNMDNDTHQNHLLHCEQTDLDNQRLFYFIPEHKRVIGIWREFVTTKETAHGMYRRFQWNYNVNLLRTCLVRIPLSPDIHGMLDFTEMFMDDNASLYRYIREQNPFDLPADEDARTRLFGSLTVYVNANQTLLHIPWVREGAPWDAESDVAYDISEFREEVFRIMTMTNSGQSMNDRIQNEVVFYFYFQFLRDPNPVIPAPAVGPPALQRARTAQSASIQAPRRPQSMAGILVGAPFAGTKKEKHFLLGSLISRFTSSNALFQTPLRELNTCLLMSLIKAQMYCFDFDRIEKKCTKVTYTGTNYVRHKCENHYVQAICSFNPPREYPFLKQIDGKMYIRLFESQKYPDGNRYYGGCLDSDEEDAWEKASEEIYFHLQNKFQRHIDYRSLSDLGQAFSDFFNVCIAVYDVEMRCSRVHMITPRELTARQLVEEMGCIKIIHLVFDQGHMHAVSNLQSFVRSEGRKENLRFYNYCPICDQKQCRDLCKSYENTLTHISCCLNQNTSFHIGFQDEEKQQSATQYREVNFRWQRNKKGKMEPHYQCVQCGEEINQNSYMSHVCSVPIKKNQPIPDEKLYVYDLECSQQVDELGLFKHECNCLYIYQVYGDNREGEYFPDEISFIESLVREERFTNATFIAHNGGAYDIHFLLRVLERTEINHTYIPSPTSKHKFIQILLTDQNIRFIDFMRFIPGSLRSIADAFAIPVGKGDFPHRFNNGKNDAYIGCIPPLNSEEDYWGAASFRSNKDKDHFEEWYASQKSQFCSCLEFHETCCTLPKWNFQTELKKYCLLDVVVLAEIVKKYRFECMNFENDESTDQASLIPWKAPRLDPFQFMTLPQITMQTLVQGFSNELTAPYSFKGVTTFHNKKRGGQCWEAILWLNRLQDLQPEIILHRGNCLKEYYHFESNISIDGWCPQTNVAYIFLKCSYWACPKCMLEHHEMNWIIPDRQLYASEVRESYEGMMHCLGPSFARIETVWQCDFNYQFTNPYLVKCCQLMKPEDCFYGGRTEVFQLYANADKLGEDIHYYDVTSLYPSVYAHHPLPVGSPRHILGHLIDAPRFHPTASNRYFGYARIKVIPRKSDLLGLLPQRCSQTGRLSFPVVPMEGCWGTEEIYLAMQNGYHVEEIYELYYWEENQRSDQHLRGYVDYFLRMKQEAEGWKKLGATSDEPTEEEQKEIIDKLYIQNGNLGRIRANQVTKNAVKRSLAKLYLNALWGKFAQKSSKGQHKTVYGTQQFLQLWNDKTIEQKSCMFREISQGVYKVSYNLKEEFVNPVRHGNLFIAAKVTETARCVLHKQMLLVGPERVIYCDTDSVIFQYHPLLGDLTGIGLGKWTDEYPGKRIQQVYALAPKLYSLMIQNKEVTSEVFRAKGIQMTLENQRRMVFDNIKGLIESIMKGEETIHSIQVKNFNIFTNSGNSALPYGHVYSRYNEKKVRAIITKRIFSIVQDINWDEIKQIRTYPIGFDLSSLS